MTEDVTAPEDMHVWIGDLSGFEVEEWAGDDGQLALTHRCGWGEEVLNGSAFLGNIVVQALEHRRSGCLPTPPLAEPYVAPDREVVEAMHEALHNLARTGQAEVAENVAALMEDVYGPIGWARPHLEAALAAFEHTDVPPALAALPSHTSTGTCQCSPIVAGSAVVHLDDRVPPGHGWALPRSLTEEQQT